MGEYIEREALITLTVEKLQDIQNEAYDLGYQSCLRYKGLKWTEAEELQRYREANKAPSADVVEVVRCKDCEYRMNSTKMVVHCALSGIQVDEDDFCSCGERKAE